MILGQLVLITALGLLGLVLLGVGALLTAIRPTVARPFFRWLERQLRRLEASPGALVRHVQHLSIPMFPLMRLHSHFYNRLRHRRFRENLTAFLVTRTLYCGAGAICFDGGPLFRLAQRPPFLRALSRIFSGGEDRPIFENRDLFFRPWNSFRSRGRLHLMLGDANLCEWAQRLRIGATALVLEAIESGVAYEWPVLADPLAALAELNCDVELRAALPLADGSRATALEIQRRYLAGVRQALVESGSLGVAWKARVLADWQETLELLATDRERLSDRVDWLAKRQALLRELDSPEDGEVLRRRGQALMEATDPADPEERRLRELAFRLRRVDLRYHELSPRGGYRRLESAGLVRRLSDPTLVERARHEPPEDTRAWARGQAIKWAHAHALSGGAAWHRVRLGKFGWRWFVDPLDSQKGRPGRTTGR